MREEIETLARRAITAQVFPGCVIGVVGAGGEKEIMALGRLTYEEHSPQVGEDTIYDLASVTKSLPLASLAALFAAETPPRLNLGAKVKTYIPELQNDFDATIEDLLRYRVQGPRMSSLEYPTPEQIYAHVLEHGFDGPVGEPEYSNLPAFLLGIVLERISGGLLPALASKHFFEPLHMNDTMFFPSDIERVAPTEIVEGKEVRGIVHDESARVFSRARQAVGHAGLFSTAPDLLRFLEALLRGEFPPVAEFARQGLGWQLEGDLLGGSRSGPSRFGKTGFTGTSIAIDLRGKLGLVILSNRTYPKRPAGSSAINSFRAAVFDAIV